MSQVIEIDRACGLRQARTDPELSALWSGWTAGERQQFLDGVAELRWLPVEHSDTGNPQIPNFAPLPGNPCYGEGGDGGEGSPYPPVPGGTGPGGGGDPLAPAEAAPIGVFARVLSALARVARFFAELVRRLWDAIRRGVARAGELLRDLIRRVVEFLRSLATGLSLALIAALTIAGLLLIGLDRN